MRLRARLLEFLSAGRRLHAYFSRNCFTINKRGSYSLLFPDPDRNTCGSTSFSIFFDEGRRAVLTLIRTQIFSPTSFFTPALSGERGAFFTPSRRRSNSSMVPEFVSLAPPPFELVVSRCSPWSAFPPMPWFHASPLYQMPAPPPSMRG